MYYRESVWVLGMAVLYWWWWQLHNALLVVYCMRCNIHILHNCTVLETSETGMLMRWCDGKEGSCAICCIVQYVRYTKNKGTSTTLVI